ncbi:hypothetical protein MOO46_07110 [Apilactobacillus apisilvae]|uniref:Uncharacterized protein n=1 Tax=Apilactobacillus apisilvae TaxID=2923364 RepID=A0ABY4PH68_9LACO|nr:hypothetical protein [Apilactobacillus apisilvae]UQS85000.1 hypothetical protein MOO46_07110 [Apilactobacillus apisilvae]
MRNNFIYINANLLRNMVKTYGISSADFVNGLDKLPKNIILLNDDRINANNVNIHTKFSVINGQEAIKNFLLNKQIINKKFMDFERNYDLNLLLDTEIASLLYFGHMGMPIDNPFSSKLQNKYVYVSNKNNLLTTYYRNFADFNHILNIGIKRHLRILHNSRRMFIRPLLLKNVPIDILKFIIKVSTDGIFLSFDKTNEHHHEYKIPLLIENKPQSHYIFHDNDDIYEDTIRVGYLKYNFTNSKWQLHIDDESLPSEIYEILN